MDVGGRNQVTVERRRNAEGPNPGVASKTSPHTKKHDTTTVPTSSKQVRTIQSVSKCAPVAVSYRHVSGNSADCTPCAGLDWLPKVISEMVGQTCRFAAAPSRAPPTISEMTFGNHSRRRGTHVRQLGPMPALRSFAISRKRLSTVLRFRSVRRLKRMHPLPQLTLPNCARCAFTRSLSQT